MASRSGASAGGSVTLRAKFYQNGVLFNPYSVSNVGIYNAETGGTLQATLTPTNESTGVYAVTWTIPSTTANGTYYDQWTWVADNGMSSNSIRYSVVVNGFIDPATSGTQTGRRVKGPLFVGAEEVKFFNHINKELIQHIVREKVFYYSVSEQHTKSNSLYDEAVRKTVYTPVEINALVLYKEPEQTNTQFSIDTIYSLEVYFHQNELKERLITPREGDFLKYGNIVYEIEKLTKPQIVYGQMQNEVMVKANCRVARKSNFEVLDTEPAHSG